MSKKGPKTQVSFAATKAFAERWPREAEIQQKAFEAASWQKDTCEEAHAKIEREAEEHMVRATEAIGAVAAVSFVTFCGGFLIGMLLALYLKD